MKKLSIIFAFVLFCFAAQAQNKIDLIGGKWVYDIDETILVNAEIKADFEKLTDAKKVKIREACAAKSFEFKKVDTVKIHTFFFDSKGNFELKKKTLTISHPDHKIVYTIQSYKKNLLIVNDEAENQMLAFKRHR